MPRPTHWIVFVTDKDTNETTQHAFTERSRARGFAMIQKALGHAVRVEAKGL